jgi:hypothetical protein
MGTNVSEEHIASIARVLKMKAENSSETLVPIYKSTRRHNPDDHYGRLHRLENLKPQICFLSYYVIVFLLNPLSRVVLEQLIATQRQTETKLTNAN